MDDAGGTAQDGDPHRLLVRVAVVGLRISLVVSPWPSAVALRRLFARWGAERAARVERYVPGGVTALIDERYGADADTLLDVYVPDWATAEGATPPATLVWVHGGAFVGGSKDELEPYLRLLAARGLGVVGVGYSRAPGAHYPTPVRQVAAALEHLRQHAARLHLDTDRVVLAGDSAGAHIAAQLAAMATDSRYAAEVGVDPGIAMSHLRGAVLCCGVFDLTAIQDDGPFRHLVDALGWAYSGVRRFRDDPTFAGTTALVDHVTGSFPPTFVTVGDADALRPQSLAMVSALRAREVAVDELVHDSGHLPPLGHEYQFELDLPEARAAFERIVEFCHRCAASGRTSVG